MPRMARIVKLKNVVLEFVGKDGGNLIKISTSGKKKLDNLMRMR